MEPIPLSIHTLYAELAQQVETAGDEASVVQTDIKGVRYLRLQRWVGQTRRVEHLGRADDPSVLAKAEAARQGMGRRKARRRLVSLLRRAIPGPSPKLGKVLDAVADAGLFRRGAVLVGTAAYQCYPALVGCRLPAGSLMTQDADIATLDLGLHSNRPGRTMEAILRRADPGFAGIPGLDPGAPASRFRSPDGFVVDLLTPQRHRDDRDPMPLAGLGAGATPLQHLDWLVADPVASIALHGAGVPIVVPQPARYTVHKLIVAQKRPPGGAAKRRKDLMQAQALMEALGLSAPFELEDALEDARSQGRDGWAKPIARSLAQLEVHAYG